ncbi:LysR substrate-binding domain-containing protein [Rhizobium rhizogenes]|uniref:LysR substrate-binding domain-containing protein n=1 Tax=Rhizobium rhizogenes TaxID=359 RepID=UPI000648EC04|nr:LysR substrate-binding domain-containing protein [Rhizobium rhizogenes]
MDKRRKLPLAALRAFEATARHGRFTAAADELGVTHGAISKHVSQLEAHIGVPLFEGARNRPYLTDEGRIFSFALTAAFDQIDDAVRMISKQDISVLDVSCLSTLAMRWLIPRLQGFADKYPQYDVRLATDFRPTRRAVDVEIFVVPPDVPMLDDCSLLFKEQLGLVFAKALSEETLGNRHVATALPRLETRTRPYVWKDWMRIVGQERRQWNQATKVFDHYHLTIEAALSGLGAAIVPWHLVADEIERGRLIAPWGFFLSEYRYVVRAEHPGRRKINAFIDWLQSETSSLRTE